MPLSIREKLTRELDSRDLRMYYETSDLLGDPLPKCPHCDRYCGLPDMSRLDSDGKGAVDGCRQMREFRAVRRAALGRMVDRSVALLPNALTHCGGCGRPILECIEWDYDRGRLRSTCDLKAKSEMAKEWERKEEAEYEALRQRELDDLGKRWEDGKDAMDTFRFE